jgi:hypothetical protein
VEQLNLLGVALGLATLAGINLYLTVFVTGLAVNQHWITLSEQYQSLEVLAHPVIITIAGVLYFLEFLADKIPWVDSAWDAVHTSFVRLAARCSASRCSGIRARCSTWWCYSSPAARASSRTPAKASSRLVANTSPEPFSNIGLSLVEDAAVFGGLALIYYNPLLALGIFAAAVLAFIYFAPRILRAMKAKIWLIFQKLNLPAYTGTPATLPTTLPSNLQAIWSQDNILNETIAWAAPCLSGRGRRIPANVFGSLVATNEEPKKLVFVAAKGRGFAQAISLEDSTVAREPKFLSENLVIAPVSGKGLRYLFVFPRSSGAMVEEISEYLKARLTAPTAELAEPEQEREPVLHA